jgi:predicted nucleotidyltransferase component of viral defense system
MERLYLSVLSRKQINLLRKLKFLKKYGFYLAGGTALALQIGHRTSVDFDFYTEKKFDSRKLREEFDKRFKKVQEIYIAEDTLELNVDGVGMSFFRYPYKLIRTCQEINGINLASKEDIAAMKIISISQRGRRRDFIDIYFLIKEFGFAQIIQFVKEKYPMFNIYVGLQGLTYFKDADEDPEKGRFKLLKEVKWAEIKKFIIKEVKKFKLPCLGK